MATMRRRSREESKPEPQPARQGRRRFFVAVCLIEEHDVQGIEWPKPENCKVVAVRQASAETPQEETQSFAEKVVGDVVDAAYRLWGNRRDSDSPLRRPVRDGQA